VTDQQAADGQRDWTTEDGQDCGRHKMARHFQLTINVGSFRWSRIEESIQKEAGRDGIYVIRNSEPRGQL